MGMKATPRLEHMATDFASRDSFLRAVIGILNNQQTGSSRSGLESQVHGRPYVIELLQRTS